MKKVFLTILITGLLLTTVFASNSILDKEVNIDNVNRVLITTNKNNISVLAFEDCVVQKVRFKGEGVLVSQLDNNIIIEVTKDNFNMSNGIIFLKNNNNRVKLVYCNIKKAIDNEPVTGIITFKKEKKK